MPAELLNSQFADMEEPRQEQFFWELDGSGSLPDMLAAALVCVRDVLGELI